MKLILMILSVASMILGCAQKKNFAGQGVAVSTAEAEAVVSDPAPPLPPPPTNSVDLGSCVDGDRVVPALTAPIKECIDSGKTWHFESKTCVDMPKASFTCDWETLQGKLKELSLLTETLQKDAAAGAKLVSCGQSSDGNRFGVQWLKPASGANCQNIKDGYGVTTGCYTHYVNRDPPPPAATDEERRQRVAECLKNL